MRVNRLLLGLLVPFLTIVLPGDARPQDTYEVIGGDMGRIFNHVRIWVTGGSAVLDAMVTVNGTVLSNGGVSETYSGQLPAPLSPGETVTLIVEIGDSTITGIDVMPEAPAVTGPADGSEFGPLDTITVTWTSSTDPDAFRLFALWSGTGEIWEISGDTRTFDIPVGEMAINEPIVLNVFSYNFGEFTGPYDPISAMNIRGESGPFPTVTIIDLTPFKPTTWGELKSQYE